MQFRVLDAAPGAIKFEAAKGSIGSFVRPGNPVVPVATVVSFATLAAGSYRLEVTIGHAGAQATMSRSAEFEIRP
jgi:hypothetical protein